YTYTDCDLDGGRWRVQVPRNPEVCQIVQPAAPLRGKDCGFACDAGSYLDLGSQECRQCPPGTYSLGSGVRFDEWDGLPKGFETYAEAVTFTQYGYHSKINNCSLSGWKPAGQYIVSNQDDCTSSLSFTVELQQKGVVSFNYQYSDPDLVFHFYVQNDMCQPFHDQTRNVFLNTTGTVSKKWSADLEPGSYILYWKTTGIMVGNKKTLNPVKISSIEITGVSYSTECHKCRSGYFAQNTGSRWCDLCPVNTFSDRGAITCNPCDTETQYSPLASSECFNRPACEQKDYFATHSPCDLNKMTNTMYKWIEPKICLDSLPQSVSLPPSGQSEPCSPCNPGFYPPDNATCLLCPPNTFSDGSHDCQPCPASTAPHYGMFNLWWQELPSNMKTSCIGLSKLDCAQKKGWEAVGDQVRTMSYESGEAYLILVMSLQGFMGKLNEKEVGRITFAFQLDCEGECQLYFMKASPSDVRNLGTNVVESWRGEQLKQTYTYSITENKHDISFTWAFQKSRGVSNPSDTARLFLVNVTNAVGGAADSCTQCAVGQGGGNQCIPCPKGSYIDPSSKKCVACTGNNKLKLDKTGCEPCGAGTAANSDHTQCTNNCIFHSDTTGRQYNFTGLPSTQSATTVPSFTSTGRKYNHVYNFSFCGNQGIGKAECIDNVTSANQASSDVVSGKVVGMVCRSTAVLMYGNQPITIVSDQHFCYLIVTLHPSLPDVVVSRTKYTVKCLITPNVPHRYSGEEGGEDQCPHGRHSYIHMRCDPTIADEAGVVSMQRECPDGTCDGCSFNFLWRTPMACPLCIDADYEEVAGACVHGQITTKFMWKNYPRKCRGGVVLPESKMEGCQDILFYVEIGVIGGVALLFMMCTAVCCLWKKSKKLEYKYHRLVMNSNGKNDGELPNADSCALSDSDSDYEEQSDEVVFQKKKARLFGKVGEKSCLGF
uniref:MRH domain-containing protein n=1 Tax=Ciona savignyi TaxID=51511 RepID=H2ZGD3_CIOSA